MREQQVTVLMQSGLHARPAAAFVHKAQSFQAAVRLRYGDREADAKSVLAVLSLGVPAGSVVTVLAEGPDEAEATQALVEMLTTACPQF